MSTTTMAVAETDSPIGMIRVGAIDGEVCAATFADHWDSVARSLGRHLGPFDTVSAADPARSVTALNRYFDGDLTAFDELQLAYVGTEFQQSVWRALRDVPAGATASYRDIAQTIGLVGAVRAVGSANGANPIVVIVPCHRIVRADGHLGGYGGGLDRKRWLLRHEGVVTRG